VEPYCRALPLRPDNPHVVRAPNEIALICEDHHLTFRELNARANQVANRLQQLGVGPDTLVGLCVERSPEMIVGLLGILKAGGAYVPLDPSYPADRLAYMMADSRAPVVITASKEGRRHSATDADPVADPFLSQIRNAWSVVDLNADQQVLTELPDNNLENRATYRSLAYVIYTSGSTGRPKGVMISHRSAVHLAFALKRAIYDRYPGERLRIGLNAPLSFDASVKQVVMMIHGHTLDILPQHVRFDGAAMVEYIRDHRIDALDCVPSQLTLLLAAGFINGGGWMPRLVLSGGEAIGDATWRVLAAAPTVNVFNVYGPTECTVDATTANARMVPERATIGKPLSNVRTYVLDTYGQFVPIGVAGELHIGGAGVGRGYLHQPDLTAEKFIADPFVGPEGAPEPGVTEARLYKTGDLVRYRRDGNLEFLGRIDDQVKLRGFRIELGEIETVLATHPGVHAAVAHVREDGASDRRLVAYIVYRPGEVQTASDMRNYIRQRLPEYMIPSLIVELERIPLTPNGKVDRLALPDPFTRAEGAIHGFTEPVTPTEEALVAIWREVLKAEQVGVEDDFFEAGGHSLLAMQVVSRVERAFGVSVSVRRFFESPTIRALASHIEPRLIARPVPCVPGSVAAVTEGVDEADATPEREVAEI
jgi:amino acid adenylation domain-containing protein